MGLDAGVATNFGVVSVIVTTTTPTIVAVGGVAVLAAAIVAVNSALVGATTINVMDAVNVEVVAMMVIDGEGCVRRLDAKL